MLAPEFIIDLVYKLAYLCCTWLFPLLCKAWCYQTWLGSAKRGSAPSLDPYSLNQSMFSRNWQSMSFWICRIELQSVFLKAGFAMLNFVFSIVSLQMSLLISKNTCFSLFEFYGIYIAVLRYSVQEHSIYFLLFISSLISLSNT